MHFMHHIRQNILDFEDILPISGLICRKSSIFSPKSEISGIFLSILHHEIADFMMPCRREIPENPGFHDKFSPNGLNLSDNLKIISPKYPNRGYFFRAYGSSCAQNTPIGGIFLMGDA